MGVKWGKREVMQYRGKYLVTYTSTAEPVPSILLAEGDDEPEVLVIMVEGFADDIGDKGPGKALSYAMKYAHLKTFGIETGEDDEQRIPDDEVEDLTIGDVKGFPGKLLKFAERLFGDEHGDRMLTMLAQRIYHIDNGEWYQIPWLKYQDAKSRLQAKADQASAAAPTEMGGPQTL